MLIYGKCPNCNSKGDFFTYQEIDEYNEFYIIEICPNCDFKGIPEEFEH